MSNSIHYGKYLRFLSGNISPRVCGVRFEHAKHITMHVVPRQHFINHFLIGLNRKLQNYYKNLEKCFSVTDINVWIMKKLLYKKIPPL